MAFINCLVLSDTHNEWPYSDESPAPKVDVFIHCGDLTQYGGLPSFKRAMDNINSVDAELKLVIAGNHDVDIDPVWLAQFAEDEDDAEVGAKCLSLVKSQKEHGTYYLDEGVHAFTLQDGRSFRVYATPYTPKFGEFAFLYGEDEDRFNEGANILDMNRKGDHCGCEKLAKALQRSRPRLACFGHIHEGRGAVKMNWEDEKIEDVRASDGEIEVSRSGEEGTMETVLVNAAVFGDGKGWLVNLKL